MIGNNTPDTRLERLKQRLERAYEAEQRALDSQSTSNAEGEQNQQASLKQIQDLIKDLESQIAAIEGVSSSVTVFWDL